MLGGRAPRRGAGGGVGGRRNEDARAAGHRIEDLGGQRGRGGRGRGVRGRGAEGNIGERGRGGRGRGAFRDRYITCLSSAIDYGIVRQRD